MSKLFVIYQERQGHYEDAETILHVVECNTEAAAVSIVESNPEAQVIYGVRCNIVRTKTLIEIPKEKEC